MNNDMSKNSKILGIASIILYILPVFIRLLTRFIGFLHFLGFPFYVWQIIMWLQLVFAIGALVLGILAIANKEKDQSNATTGIGLGVVGLILWILNYFWHIGLWTLLAVVL